MTFKPYKLHGLWSNETDIEIKWPTISKASRRILYNAMSHACIGAPVQVGNAYLDPTGGGSQTAYSSKPTDQVIKFEDRVHRTSVYRERSHLVITESQKPGKGVRRRVQVDGS